LSLELTFCRWISIPGSLAQAGSSKLGEHVPPLEGDLISLKLEGASADNLKFNAVEQFAFVDAVFAINTANSNYVPGGSSEAATTQLLQACLLICIYQNWEGDALAKQRLRRYRFGVVVAVRFRQR
jgi:hypothetical protein